jgi:hypothetical protein
MKFTWIFFALGACLPWAAAQTEDVLTRFDWTDWDPGCSDVYPDSWSFDACAVLQFCSTPDGGYGYKQPDSTSCSSPGPLIRVEAGTKYLLTLENTVPDTVTNVHTHGLHIRGDGNGDSVVRTVNFEDCLHYVWDVPASHMGGTFWYHAHVHGLTNAQVGGGALGMVVVEDDPDALIPSDVSASGAANIEAFLGNEKAVFASKLGNTWYGNGIASGAQVNLKVNEWTRLRVAISDPNGKVKEVSITATSNQGSNPCSDVLWIATDGVYGPEVPGGTLPKSITGASRIDLALRCGAGDAYLRFGNTVVAKIHIEGSTGLSAATPYSESGDLTTTWTPERPFYLWNLMDETSVDNYFAISMSASQINGESWDPNTPLDTFDLGETHEWVLSGTGAHPLHIHLYHMQVLSDGCGDHKKGYYYDTISSSGDCTVRFPTEDFGGVCVLHCHVLSHEDSKSQIFWLVVRYRVFIPSPY